MTNVQKKKKERRKEMTNRKQNKSCVTREGHHARCRLAEETLHHEQQLLIWYTRKKKYKKDKNDKTKIKVYSHTAYAWYFSWKVSRPLNLRLIHALGNIADLYSHRVHYDATSHIHLSRIPLFRKSSEDSRGSHNVLRMFYARRYNYMFQNMIYIYIYIIYFFSNMIDT